MPPAFDSRDTRVSLLDGLRNSQDADLFGHSWERFNEKYTPKIYAWARRMGLSEADAEEVCQELMLTLLKRLKTLIYDPRQTFQGWLRTVTRNAVIDFIKMRKRMQPTEGEVVQFLVEKKPLEDQLEQLFDEELLEVARSRAEAAICRTEAGRRNWQVFLRLETDGLAPEAVAEEFGIRRHAVYVARNRVLEILKEEVRLLNSEPHVTP